MVDKAPIRVSYEATNGTRESTVASELSLGGVFVETQLKSPKVGSLVALEIESGATKVAIDGRVLSHSPKGFSVSFIDLPNDVASALHFILATRMPRRGTTLGLGEAEEGVAKYVSEPRLPAAPPPPPPAHVEAPPASVKPAASGAPPMPEVDAYAPRHPTPRIMPAAPISQPPPATPHGMPRGPYSSPPIPPAPTSSAPGVAMMVPNAPSSRPHVAWAPPSSPMVDAPFKSSKKGVILAMVVIAVVIAVGVAIALHR